LTRCAILTAAIGLEANVNGHVDALVKRRMLPDDEPLNLRSVAIVALAGLRRGARQGAICGAGITKHRLSALHVGKTPRAARRWHGATYPRPAARSAKS
jgi:hypothetical protein